MPIPSHAQESPYQIEPANLAEVQSENVLQASPTPVFHLVHYPDNWEIGLVDEGGQKVAYWLPEMQAVPVVPGVNMCRTLRKDEPKEAAYTGQLAWFAQRGQIAVPMDAIVGKTDCYIARVACQHPRTKRVGKRHFDCWSRPKPTKVGKSVKFWRDELAANAWRLELVRRGWVRPDGTTGRLPDADPDVIAEKIDRAEYHLARKEAETGLPERAYENEVKARQALLEQHTGAKVPTFEGVTAAVPVVDYSTALIQALASRVKAGEEPDAVLATFPDLGPAIVAAVHAAKPAPKPASKGKGKGE